ncbi:MAG: hypothetical protein ACJAXA_001430 [Candidatus Aldehydirespiratoraceae bacterium]|jgi:hypothetical protein
MTGIDEYGVRDAIGVVVDVVANRVDRFIDCNGDYLKVVTGEFFLECLPTWQIEKATSPT